MVRKCDRTDERGKRVTDAHEKQMKEQMNTKDGWKKKLMGKKMDGFGEEVRKLKNVQDQ